MRLALVAVLLLSGCGRISFDSRGRDDATTITDDGGALGDARMVDAPRYFLDAGECPPGYTAAGTTCYRWVEESVVVTWVEGELLCEQDAEGAHLAIVADAAEGTDIDNLVVAQEHWIGSTDRLMEGTYTNVNGTATTYLQWAGGFPTGAASDCLALDVAGQVIDRNCDELHNYVCEYDGQLVQPGTF